MLTAREVMESLLPNVVGADRNDKNLDGSGGTSTLSSGYFTYSYDTGDEDGYPGSLFDASIGDPSGEAADGEERLRYLLTTHHDIHRRPGR